MLNLLSQHNCVQCQFILMGGHVSHTVTVLRGFVAEKSNSNDKNYNYESLARRECTRSFGPHFAIRIILILELTTVYEAILRDM